jgi:hypothetical protein
MVKIARPGLVQGQEQPKEPWHLHCQQAAMLKHAELCCAGLSCCPACVLQCTDVLQKEAADLSSRADAEMQGVMDELARVHRLVASFQDQIREVSNTATLKCQQQAVSLHM